MITEKNKKILLEKFKINSDNYSTERLSNILDAIEKTLDIEIENKKNAINKKKQDFYSKNYD